MLSTIIFLSFLPSGRKDIRNHFQSKVGSSGHGSENFSFLLLASGRVSLYVQFYITGVKKTLLGLQDVQKGGVLLNFRDGHISAIQKEEVEEPRPFHNTHFYLEALVLPQDGEAQQPRTTKVPHHNYRVKKDYRNELSPETLYKPPN